MNKRIERKGGTGYPVEGKAKIVFIGFYGIFWRLELDSLYWENATIATECPVGGKAKIVT